MKSARCEKCGQRETDIDTPQQLGTLPLMPDWRELPLVLDADCVLVEKAILPADSPAELRVSTSNQVPSQTRQQRADT